MRARAPVTGPYGTVLRRILALSLLLPGAEARPQPGARAGAPPQPTAPGPTPGPGRGFPEVQPWVSFYGRADQMGSLARAAARFRVINIDADPAIGNFTPAQIAVLRAGGRNRVISYLNVGACESFRRYWQSAPAGFVSCRENRKAQRGRYQGYPDEVWMDPSDRDYQRLLVGHVAPALAATGVDGFFLDNLEILEHDPEDRDGGCDPRCQRGGLELLARLRAAFPQHLIVMQNTTSEVTRLGRTGGAPVPSLLDGVTREGVYTPHPDGEAEAELAAWAALRLSPGGRRFFIGTEDYVGGCHRAREARRIYDRSRQRGFSPYATDASAGQQVVCYWGF
jgi:cysteinyl-tRNA synthetase